MTFSALFLALVWLFLSSGSSSIEVKASTFSITNKCAFPIWPATAANTGQPVLAKGGFYLAPGKTRKFQGPGEWSGRIWARTGCSFTNQTPACCETGDCDGKLECGGSIGVPPATLIEITIQTDRRQPNLFDVSLVDGYNLPVQVTTKDGNYKIRGCWRSVKSVCPVELQVKNVRGEIVACKSACLAFNLDSYCCRNEYATPKKCRPNMYSRIFKDACPEYFSIAFDTPSPLVSCAVDSFVITFCPGDLATE